MPTVDVVDLTNSKVGELELADEVFGAWIQEYETKKGYLERVRHLGLGDEDFSEPGDRERRGLVVKMNEAVRKLTF